MNKNAPYLLVKRIPNFTPFVWETSVKNLKLFINQELPISIWLIISSNYIGTCNTAIIQCFCFHRCCYFQSLNQSCRFLSVRNCKEKSCCFQKSCQYFPLLQQLCCFESFPEPKELDLENE